MFAVSRADLRSSLLLPSRTSCTASLTRCLLLQRATLVQVKRLFSCRRLSLPHSQALLLLPLLSLSFPLSLSHTQTSRSPSGVGKVAVLQPVDPITAPSISGFSAAPAFHSLVSRSCFCLQDPDAFVLAAFVYVTHSVLSFNIPSHASRTPATLPECLRLA